MVPSILSGARVRHLHRRDELADRVMAAGFVAVVFLSACTDVLGCTFAAGRVTPGQVAVEAAP